MLHVKNLIPLMTGKKNNHLGSDERHKLISSAFRELNDGYCGNFAPMIRQNHETDIEYNSRVKRSLSAWARAWSVLTDQQIRIGVARCIIEVPFGAKLTPADITTRAHAEPQHLGFACVDDAFIECVKNRHVDEDKRSWSSGLIAHAFTECTSWVWTRLSEKEQRANFKRQYMYLFNALIRSGKSDMDIPRALPAPEHSEEDHRRMLVHMFGEERAQEIINTSSRAAGMDDVMDIMRGQRQPDTDTKESRS